eukprot:TRINITY_DN4644_c0_g1_i1.p1 TRINITY_DN4644_c0_g1~~TRINITY_DN4644_c0_g1_i1.p1  ORF type:complete len:162 (-),score=27.55 TRINITY_DN4644_c0_g1_i1:31-516(-)
MNCDRCKKAVYAAEKLTALGRTFHKTCFKCGSCSKTLAPGGFVDHENLQYCQSCFDKNFRMKGYGFGGGGALDSFQSTATPAPPVNASNAAKPTVASPPQKSSAPSVSSPSFSQSPSKPQSTPSVGGGKTCRSCKTANASGIRFCAKCGMCLFCTLIRFSL